LTSMSKIVAPEADSASEEHTMLPHGRVLTTTETDVRFLQKASRANARDAFDPAKFNELFHKSPRTENSDQTLDDNKLTSASAPEALNQD
jgi:hypothetical protein